LGAQLGSNYGLVPDVPDDADYHHHDAQRCDSDCSQAVLPIYGFDPEKITPADAGPAELETRRTLAHLTAMDQVGTALAREYDAVLKGN
jgi:hypothetical protein